MDNRKTGFYKLVKLLRQYKRAVTYTEVITAINEEGWTNVFLRMGINSATRQINKHNEKYNGPQYSYGEEFWDPQYLEPSVRIDHSQDGFKS